LANDVAKDARTQVIDAAKQIAYQIETRPVQSVAIALGDGFMLGFICQNR